jgi:lambda repressor-like predicted transcriptional regulator
MLDQPHNYLQFHRLTSGEITHAAWLRSRGISLRRIAEEFGVSEEAVRINTARHPLIGSSFEQFQNMGIAPDTAWNNRKRANVLHLMDLKNAGHSSRRTEFNISPDQNLRTTFVSASTSGCGSPAAMCADA